MGLLDERTGGLVTHWKSVAGITALVGEGTAAKIVPHAANEGEIPPYIVYGRRSGRPYRHLLGTSGLRIIVVEVVCYGQTLAQADDLADLVKVATETMRGNYSGVNVHAVKCEDIDDSLEFRQPGSDQKDYWVRLVMWIEHGE